MAYDRIDDIEERLSRRVGDIAAHQVGRVLRGAAGWTERAVDIFAANVREYLEEESRQLVTRAELAEFCESVNELHDAVEALAARIQDLTA